MLKRPHYIALIVVVLLALLLLSLPASSLARIKVAIGSLFLPLFGLANSSHQVAGKLADSVVPRDELTRQNDTLRRENRELRLRQTHSLETQRENDRLRQLIGWQQKGSWKLKLGNVIVRDPANWWRTVQIDLGTRDGVHPDLPVLTPEGLVGRVLSASLTRSQVALLGDPNCKVAALIDNEARDKGVVETAGPFDGSLLSFNYVARDAVLKPGEEVLTSGLGGVFPKGIPVGKIVDFRPVEYGLYIEARIRPSANLSGLEEVWVLLP